MDEAFPLQAQPTPVGSGYVAALADESGAVSLNVEFDGPGLDELLSGVDQLVESGQAEITEGPEEIEVEGADEAARVELAAPEGGATATGLFAVADGHAISLAIEVTEEADVDVEAIVDSLRIDPERLELEGTAELPEGGATDGATDAGTDPGTDGAGTDGAGTDGATDGSGTDGAADGAGTEDAADGSGTDG